MRVSFRRAARTEVVEAIRWYGDRSPLSALAFAQAIDDAVMSIARSPDQYPIGEHDLRKFTLQ